MPFVEGAPLSHLLRGAPLPSAEVASLVCRLALSVDVMHRRGMIHRDLKPGNILIRPDGSPVVMDFGLSRSLSGADRLTATGALVGTPAYMSPEQLRGEQDTLGPETDVYSLGVILFELLTGRLPFTGSFHSLYSQILHSTPPPPSQFRPGLDPHLDDVCLKAMAKDSAARYPDMAEFAADLARAASDGTQPLTPVPGPAAPTPNTRLEVTALTGAPEDPSVAPTEGLAQVVVVSPSPPKSRPRVTRRRVLTAAALLTLSAAILAGVLYASGAFDPAPDEDVDPEVPFLERVRSEVTFRATMSPKQVDTFQGKPRHYYTLWVEAPPDIMEQIDRVVYLFNPRLFSDPRRESTDRRDHFKNVYIGTGAVNADMDIILVLHDGREVTLKLNVFKALGGK
jgi:serine/threonine protein kinase